MMGDVQERLDKGDGLWLGGHSPVSGGKGQLERQLDVRASLPHPPPAIAMHFLVGSYTRRGHYFDMESLGYVVLASWRHDLTGSGPVKLAEPFQPDAIWLTMRVSDGEVGVRLIHESPPKPPPELVRLEVEIERPPSVSVRGTVIPELQGCAELDEAPWLGLELRFGPHVDIAEFGFEGPIKPLIDAMGPVLGLDRRGGPADHRLHDLRIRRDPSRRGGVLARLWHVPE